MDKNDSDKRIETLREEDIQQARPVGRRSALTLMGATVAGSAAIVAGVGVLSAPSRASAQTDSDTGGNADAAGRGRTGNTDRDSGGNSDRAGHGVCPGRGHTDSDTGGNSDPAGRGRGPCR